jgi:hypothetical protein
MSMFNAALSVDNSNKGTGIGEGLPSHLRESAGPMEPHPWLSLVGVASMEAYQWFLLGMMAAWMPLALALALMLWRSGQNSADNRIL